MEPNGPARVHLVPFVHSLSYIPIRIHLVPNYHLAGSPLELPKGPLGVPGPHFENQCSTDSHILVSVQQCTDQDKPYETFVVFVHSLH